MAVFPWYMVSLWGFRGISIFVFQFSIYPPINIQKLFGEIGEFFKFAKISCHQIETLQSLDITSVGNRQINSRQIAIFEKPPNIIASFYSIYRDLILDMHILCYFQHF